MITQLSLPLLSWPQRCIYHFYYSFREALPGLIGSSWSQNPCVAAATRAGHAHSPSVSTGFYWLHGEQSFCAKVAMRPAGQTDGGSWPPPAKPEQRQKKRTPGETLSPGSALITVGKALESHRLSVQPASFMGPLFPVGHICILTSRFSMHMDMNKRDRKRIKEVCFKRFLFGLNQKGKQWTKVIK